MRRSHDRDGDEVGKGIAAYLYDCLRIEAEQQRLLPWGVVAFGCGILLYFASDGHVHPSVPLTGLCLACGFAVLLRHRWGTRLACIGLAALLAGFSVMSRRVISVDAPILGRSTIADFSGSIESVDLTEKGGRLIIVSPVIDGLEPERTPYRMRVRARGMEGVSPGVFVSGKVRLMPPPQPVLPGGYDFARDSYFKGIGAVGTVLGTLQIEEPTQAANWRFSVSAWVDHARNRLTERIAGTIRGEAGGVSAALVTGKRGYIPESANEALRAAGIYHIVSISGLHMVLAAGLFFWWVRACLALIPVVALTWPVKKISAVSAMIGATVYCVFSGAEVAAVRSLVMTLIMLGAILADRPALSIRNLSFATLVVLIREPEALLGPSFQMSFSAVLALLVFSGRLTAFVSGGGAGNVYGRGPIIRMCSTLFRSFITLCVTTLVATAATAPFAAYHFQTTQVYGLIGNALALPLVSLIVMPCAMIGCLAYPFGLDTWIWVVMGWATSGVLAVSHWVNGLSYAVLTFPAFGSGALLLLSFGLVWGAIPHSSLRWGAVVPALLGLAFAVKPERFDLAIDRDGRGMAFRSSEGRLIFEGTVNRFLADQWLRADGDIRFLKKDVSIPKVAEGACDRLACIGDIKGMAVSLVKDIRAFEEDCRRVDIVVTRLTAPATCTAPLILDRSHFARYGATTIYVDENNVENRRVRVQTTYTGNEAFPWVRSKESGAMLRGQQRQPKRSGYFPIADAD